MKKEYTKDSVLIKLVYFCNRKKEVYFKRSDVTEFLQNSEVFDIPKKQGFDGNLSYFGYDVQNDGDGQRILLLRGDSLNRQCLLGELKFEIIGESVFVESSVEEVFDEIDSLIDNKTYEASLFKIREKVNAKYGFSQFSRTLYGNKKLFTRDNIYYYYPRMLFDTNRNRIVYQTVSYDILSRLSLNIVFPIFNRRDYSDKAVILPTDTIFYDLQKNNCASDFYYFVEENGVIRQVDIHNCSSMNLLGLINNYKYDLSDKGTTTKILSNVRLNTSTLRTLALMRDDNKCLLCSVNDSRLLICSHILPWSSGESRLDLNNVLTLCSMHDALFDRGFISFDNKGNILYSKEPVLETEALEAIRKITAKRIVFDNDSVLKFVRYHREQILLN